MSDRMVIIGGGIAGIQAALDAANAGSKVTLVEKEGTIGGKMSVLDKNFPTLDCSICIEAPKMSDVVQNPNIEVLTLAEVSEVKGKAGDFEVRINQRPRFVTDACTRCNECVSVCPQILKNEFDSGMAARKAIYTPIEQAVPGPYVIDIQNCLNKPPNYLPCNRCMKACAPNCIDFGMNGREVVRDAASVIVSTGFDLLDASLLPQFGYGKHPDILTSMEFERLLQASGPSKGEIVKPSDMTHPESILFVLCIGSRDRRFCDYCSRICCMYSIKEAYQAADHGINATIAYMDIRAYGKGFDSFYKRAEKEGVSFIRTRPAKISPNGGKIKVRFEDTLNAKTDEKEFGMVVLATAAIPSSGTKELAKALGIEVGGDGFFATKGAVETSREGVYVCGCAAGPKDIPDSVTEAGGAVAKALTHLSSRSWPEELEVIPIDVSGEPRIGVFLCDCGSNILGVVNVPEVLGYAKTLPNVVHAEEQRFSCSSVAQERMKETIKGKKLTRVVVAACSPKTHGPTFQRVCSRAGLNQYLFEMANVRNQNSWVHKKEKAEATEKAKEMVRMSVAKARLLKPVNTSSFPVTGRVLVIGGGVSGMTAAANLANQGIETYLVERDNELGGMVNRLDIIAPSGMDARKAVDEKRKELLESGAKVLLNTTIEKITGFVGSFNADFSSGSSMDFGAIILATGSNAYTPKEFGYGSDSRVTTSLEIERNLGNITQKDVTFIACVGSRNGERGCSRFCCQSMISQAIRLREAGKNVNVVYRDIRAFSRNAEEMYYDASAKGVRFFRCHDDQQKTMEGGSLVFYDEFTGSDVKVPTDLLVLNIGLVPSNDGIAQQLKVSRDEEGFLLESHPKLGPVEAAVAGVLLAGTAQGPKGYEESVSQALAASAKASAIVSKDEIEKEPFIAMLSRDKCVYCQRCVPVCPYGAIKGELRKSLEITQAMCQGCGTCAAECNLDAISMPSFTDEQIMAQIDAVTEKDASKKILVFACNWCSYAGADQAGIAKIQYPSSVRIVRTMCSGRVSQKLVMHAFKRGAGAVLVTGCHPGDCHYINANQQTLKRMEKWKKAAVAAGIDEKRLQLWWVSAAEGRRFAEKAKEMDALIRGVGGGEKNG